MIYFTFVYECFACMYVYTPQACLMLRGQKRASDRLELELQMGVNMGAGNGIRVLSRATGALHC